MPVITPSERERRRAIEDAGDLLHEAFRATRKRDVETAQKLMQQAQEKLSESVKIVKLSNEPQEADTRQMKVFE